MSSFPSVIVRPIGTDEVQSVNARDLHAFLGVGRDFSNWIKDRIEAYAFTRGTDFEVFANSGENPQGGRPASEYALTLDMAKELAMVERNAKGREVRRYFIECEKRAKAASISALPDFTNPVVAARAWADQCEGRAIAEKRLLEIEPKAVALDKLVADDGMVLISDAAKQLDLPINELFAWLRAHRWIFRRGGSKRDVAYADKLRAGLLVHKYNEVPQPNGSIALKERAMLTRKGIARLAHCLGRKVV